MFLLAIASQSQAYEFFPGGRFLADEPCVAEADEPLCSYGPTECEPRQTLLQWSYGTTFSGGPPGRDEPLASDRPDFTEASVTVGRGVVQIEMGYTYIYDNAGGESSAAHSYPEVLARIGMFAEWFELRVGQNVASGRIRTLAGDDSFRGFEDLYLGAKIGLLPQEAILPEVALVLQSTLPTGHSALSSDEVLPGFNLLYGWDLNDFLAVGASTQLNRAIDAGGAYAELAQSITVNYNVHERVVAFTEWYVIAPTGAQAARTQHVFDGGCAFRVTNDLQLDFRAGVGLNDAAPDYFIGSGAVVRF